jgi:hypothetical protein
LNVENIILESDVFNYNCEKEIVKPNSTIISLTYNSSQFFAMTYSDIPNSFTIFIGLKDWTEVVQNKNTISGNRTFKVSVNRKFILFSANSWSNWILLETLWKTEFLLLIILYVTGILFKIKMKFHSSGKAALFLIDLFKRLLFSISSVLLKSAIFIHFKRLGPSLPLSA